jgi:hypothetical protein
MEVIQVKKYKHYEVRTEFDETAEMGTPKACIVKNVYSLSGEFRGQWPLKKKDKLNKVVNMHER